MLLKTITGEYIYLESYFRPHYSRPVVAGDLFADFVAIATHNIRRIYYLAAITV